MAALPARAVVVAGPLPDTVRVSIVIPVLNEAEQLDAMLAHLLALPWVAGAGEVIVSDGGSHDASVEIARRHACRIVRGASGRAAQMNAGSAVARGEYLMFLHADSRLPGDFDAAARLTADWGFFRLRLSGASIIYRVIESAINLRTRITHVAGGDQGLYFRRDFFHAIGEFPEIPLMEDVAISKRARRRSPPVIFDARIASSSRRWQERGVVKTVLLMWLLRLAYWLGVAPERLHRLYYPQNRQGA